MSMQEVFREEEVWLHGVDWAEHQRSDDVVKRRNWVQRVREDAPQAQEGR